VIAGAEHGRSAARLAQLAADHSVVTDVRGRVDVEKWRVIKGARALVFLSRWDGPPRPVREAVAVGTYELTRNASAVSLTVSSGELRRAGWSSRTGSSATPRGGVYSGSSVPRLPTAQQGSRLGVRLDDVPDAEAERDGVHRHLDRADEVRRVQEAPREASSFERITTYFGYVGAAACAACLRARLELRASTFPRARQRVAAVWREPRPGQATRRAARAPRGSIARM
jgi:hypothetical protein